MIKSKHESLMWNSISLTPLEYKDLVKAIEDFTCDIDKLTRLQCTGHLPLILSTKNELQYNITVSPYTLEVLGKIDQRFLGFKNDAVAATVDVSIIDEQDLLLGHKESFKKVIERKFSGIMN
ncbi:MAG TPA: hypothetical protein VIT44_08645 [Cyclobacteriaceae bacterium]